MIAAVNIEIPDLVCAARQRIAKLCYGLNDNPKEFELVYLLYKTRLFVNECRINNPDKFSINDINKLNHMIQKLGLPV